MRRHSRYTQRENVKIWVFAPMLKKNKLTVNNGWGTGTGLGETTKTMRKHGAKARNDDFFYPCPNTLLYGGAPSSPSITLERKIAFNTNLWLPPIRATAGREMRGERRDGERRSKVKRKIDGVNTCQIALRRLAERGLRKGETH
eukprot:sb/3474027/